MSSETGPDMRVGETGARAVTVGHADGTQRRARRRRRLAAVTISLAVAAVGCSSGVSPDDVDRAIQAALADVAVAEPVTLSDVQAATDEAVEEALAALAAPQPTEPLTAAAIEALVEEAVSAQIDALQAELRRPDAEVPDTPPDLRESDPAGHTRSVVADAIARYDADGLEPTLAHYNDPAHIDGQWYVFVIDGDGTIIGHYDASRRGLNLNDWVGTDLNGYRFGPQMLAADENGRWVPYVFTNPERGSLADADSDSFELKNAWVVRHDGLLFGSGWHVDADTFLPALITEAAERFSSGGLEATLAFYNDPQGIAAGLIPTVQYYNSTETLDGYFSGIIAAQGGEILAHFDPALIGTPIEELLGPAIHEVTADGGWITADDNPAEAGGPRTMRIWAVDVNGTLIGGGWYSLGDD